MTTILVVGNSEGSKRCDAKCHDALGPDCDCVCGGRYHGVKQAPEQLRQDMLDGRLGPELAKAAALGGQLTLGGDA